MVVGHSFKALPEDAQGEGAAHASFPVPAALEVGAAEPIDVPKCRRLTKSQKSGGWPLLYSCRSTSIAAGLHKRGEALTVHVVCPPPGNDADDSEDSVEPRYVRFVNGEGDGMEGAVEYDMDEEDEAWLNRHTKV